ncbi:MAG: DUF134 domain-containing protein [Firmicutes bacterium]|nr:DUF134 domain-containing protein [Bacillota bacterium]
MPRKPRCRRICGFPDHWSFSADDEQDQTEQIIMSLDEYETIRLIDREGMTQEQCAVQMGVARTTVTAIYDSARKKLAQMLIEGKPLIIAGGCYEIAGKHQIDLPSNLSEKENVEMRIAVTYENGEVFQHFGHTEQLKVYDVEDGAIVSEQIVSTNGTGHGALAGFLTMMRADALICGGIGMGAQMALAEAGVKLYAGVQGSADEAAKALVEGTLAYDPDAQCDHHGEGHNCGGHEESHGCGHHEGGHGCGHHEGGHGCGRHH